MFSRGMERPVALDGLSYVRLVVVLLPPMRVAEIVECVRKCMEGSSKV